jgi:hypothetical protein
MADSEDALQISIYKLETVVYKYGIEVPKRKKKKMDFKERGPLRSKGKGKAIQLQAWTGRDGSRRLRLPDFKTIGT